MNRIAIQLNNTAIEDLQRGNLAKAFESIAIACSSTADYRHIHDEALDPTQYRFHWKECGQKTVSDLVGAVLPSQSYLYLNFLTISVPENSNIDDSCPCGFAWAIWYK